MPVSALRRSFLVTCGALLLAVLLVRCTPDPVFRLQAQAPDSTSVWQEGRRVVTQTVDSVQVAVAYGRTTDAGHKFRLAFVNRSRTSVTATPSQAYAVVTRRRQSTGRLR